MTGSRSRPRLAAFVTTASTSISDSQSAPAPSHRLRTDTTSMTDEVSAAGYELTESPDFLPYQYFLIFRKSEAITWPHRGVRE